MTARDQLVSAIDTLDPESRALLELSARRGMTDAEVAEVTGVPVADVRSRRERAMENVARAVGSSAGGGLREELEGLGEKDWARPTSSVAEAEVRGRRRTSPRFLAAAAVAVVAIAAVAAVLIASAGNESALKRAGAPARPQPATKPGGGGSVVTFKRLHRTHGRGTAQLVRGPGGARLRLRVKDLLSPQPGGYAVWLYDSPSRTRLLAFTTSTSLRRELPLRGRWSRYRFLDVSRQVTKGRYSGLTLLRASLRDLQAPGR